MHEIRLNVQGSVRVKGVVDQSGIFASNRNGEPLANINEIVLQYEGNTLPQELWAT